MSEAFDRLVAIMDRLRDPGGCPWDREQTVHTISGYLLEEAHEAVEAAAGGDPRALAEELGDLLLQIVFMARIGRERGWFDLDDVCTGIADKMVRRHPHVFASARVDSAREVTERWEEIKKTENGDRPKSTLDGVPTALPGLLKAYRMTQKAAAVGFDWQAPVPGVMAKLREEVDELEVELGSGEPGATDRVRAEMGDILFVMANLSRHLGVEPETALRESNGKFRRRFEAMEELARQRGRGLGDMTAGELDALWNEVKRAE